MTIFDALTMIGGLCLFLFGMNVMGSALERRAGGSLRTILEKLTNKPALGLLTGLGVTSVSEFSSVQFWYRFWGSTFSSTGKTF